MLAGVNAISPRDGLHQRVVAHRLVEIHGGTGRRIEPGQPHGAHEHQPQRVFGVLELLIKRRLRFVHALAMHFDIQPQLLHLCDFVLARRDDQRHAGAGENLQPLLQLGLARIPPRLRRTRFTTVRQKRQFAQFLLHAPGLRCPVRLDLVVHLERGSLVDGHHHCFAHRVAQCAAPEKMPHDVLCHRLQPVVAREQVILPVQLTLQPGFLFGVKFGILNQLVNVVIQIGIDELQFRRAVLVKQRHGRAVLHRLLEVVDRHVITEHILGALFAGNQRRAGKGEEQGLGQGRAHVQRQRVVLAAVRFVGEHDHIRPVAQHLRRLKLVDEREHVTVIAAQQLAQMRAAAGMALVALGLAHRAGGLEGLGDLLVQFHPVCHDGKGPVARHLAQHLLREEHHRKTLAAALRLPEHPAAPVPQLARFEHRGNRVVHPKKLVVLPENLRHPGLVLREQREVLYQIKQPRTVARAAQHHLQRNPARLILPLDTLPLEKPFPISRQRTNPAISAVRRNQQRVKPEQRRNLLLVVREVFIKRRPRRHTRPLELDHHPRQAVHKPHQVRPAGIQRPGHTELAHQQKIIVPRCLPIHHPQALHLLPATLAVRHRNHDAFLQQCIHLTVRRLQTHGRAVADQFIHRGGDRLGRQRRVQPRKRRMHARPKHHFTFCLALQGASGTENFLQRRHRSPAKLREQPNGGLLDKLVLGVGMRTHGGIMPSTPTPGAMCGPA